MLFRSAPLPIKAIFDDGYFGAGNQGDPLVTTSLPRLGVQMSQFPAAFDPEAAQGDTFVVVRTGKTYVVKTGMADSHGGARLDANLL